jgi:hypothetical protein
MTRPRAYSREHTRDGTAGLRRANSTPRTGLLSVVGRRLSVVQKAKGRGVDAEQTTKTDRDDLSRLGACEGDLS